MNPTSRVFADFFKDATILSSKVEFLMDKMQEGHICIDLSADELVDIQKSKYVYRQEKQPFVVENAKLYLQRYFAYETSILERIQKLIADKNADLPQRMQQVLAHKKFVQDLFSEHSKDVDWQLIAALNASLHHFAIITGGPGTGKTTTVSKLLCLLLKIQPDLKIALAAPTGKAAMRMKESLSNSFQRLTGLDDNTRQVLEAVQPQTLHRLLGYQRDSPYFKHHAEKKLPYDLIVVDEASMIDIPMMSKLLEAVDDNSRILFLGDKNQLASVEVGSVFSDLCTLHSQTNTFTSAQINFFNEFIKTPSATLGKENQTNEAHFFTCIITELQVSRRFNSEEGIGFFSKSVIEGKNISMADWKSQTPQIQKGIQLAQSFEEFREDILLFGQYIREPDIKKALSLTQLVRILCATKDGNAGVKICNQEVEKILKEAHLIQPKYGFYENQLIMITSNNYGLNLFNGDIGIVRLDAETQTLKAFFEDASQPNGIKEVASSYIKNYETAFAMTIHKSQGSEFDTAIIVMPETEMPILNRQLLYTGITRAKTMAKIKVNQAVLDFSIQNQVQRSSGIQPRIKQWA